MERVARRDEIYLRKSASICGSSCLPFAVQTLGIVHFLEDSLLGGDSAELVDVGGVSGAEGGEDKSPGWG